MYLKGDDLPLEFFVMFDCLDVIIFEIFHEKMFGLFSVSEFLKVGLLVIALRVSYIWFRYVLGDEENK